MIMFFVLGIMMTTILLGRKKWSNILICIEFLFDEGLIIFVYFNNDSVYMGKSIMTQEQAIALAFALVSLTLISLFTYQDFVNREMRKRVEIDNESIKKADNTKGRFLANMTHEIRTPMNAIIGMTNLILKEELTNYPRESINIIKTESARLLQIINNILEYSKLDSGRAELINNTYSFREMITDVIQTTLVEYKREDVKMHVFISKSIPDKLFGDEVRIKQLMRYLLFSNLTRTPGGIVNIEITSDYDELTCILCLKFRITSVGTGLNADEINAIYNAYSSYDSRQKTDYNRAGLEISICKKVLNMMGGDLIIDSIMGIGNAFEFSFNNFVVDTTPIASFDKGKNVRPLIYIKDKATENAWYRIVEELGISANYVRTPQSFIRAIEKNSYTAIYIPQSIYEELNGYIKTYDCEDIVYVLTDIYHSIGDFGNCRILRHPVYLFNLIESLDGTYNIENYKNAFDIDKYVYPNANVLVVDDSKVNLKVFDNLLKDFEVKAELCESGKKALDLLHESEYDIIFIDQKMPEMDGFELADRIRKMSNVNSLAPLICATADIGSGLRDTLLKRGFNDYLSKPINVIYLEKMLKTFLPEELRVSVIKKDDKKIKNKNKSDAPAPVEEKVDPLEFDPAKGISNLGDNLDAYLSVLESYYLEGIQKLTDVPKQFEDGDISLYTTNVHALKSSSATVGCIGISPMFKELEFAGKQSNTEFIKENSANVFGYFKDVLEKVKVYLTENGMLAKASDSDEQMGEEIALDMALVSELSDSVRTMNLRRCEEIINEFSSNNYGNDINQIIKKIKNSYDNFEYMEIMSYVKELV